MRLRRSVAMLTMAVATATSLGVATPAHASNAWDLIISTTDDNPGGRLWFGANGDVVQACDVQADGKRAVGSVYNSNGSLRYRFTASGHGTCVTKGASMEGIYDLTEGATYQIQICLTDDSGALKFCRSAWTTA